MRLSLISRRPRTAGPGQVAGVVKLDRRTQRLVGRLRPGDIALIDHIDLDRVSAAALVAARVCAVLNVRPSISGRYPNLGPELLIRAGIPLIDDLGDDIFQQVREGEPLVLDEGAVLAGGAVVALGIRQDADRVATAMKHAGEGLSVQLEAFAANTREYLKQERELLLDGVGVPEIRTVLADRHCVVVTRGADCAADLRALRPYVRERRPVLIGVDGGADALLEAGYQPDLIVGNLEPVSDAALTCGAEIVVHVHPGRRGPGPGLHRLARLNLPAVSFPAAATSEDLALLLADQQGAALIVTVGSHATLGEFLDRERTAVASTFLTRLKVAGKLVDARGLLAVHRATPSTGALALLIGSALAAMAVAALAASSGRGAVATVAGWWESLMTLGLRLL